MRERIESKHVTKEIKSQMPVIPVEIVKERSCTFCPYYGYEFGMDLAFGVLSVFDGKPERVLEIQKYVNEQYECCSNKKFMKVLETIARMNGNEEVYIEDMYACNKEARNYYLSELMMCFNFVFNEMCHGTGSAAGCDFNNEEE